MDLVEILLVVLLTLRSMASTRGFSLPSNCQKSCGNIIIEWTFGIGNGCFRPGFNLTCNYTTNPPTLFLGDGTIEVSEIDMDQGLVYVKIQIVTMGVGRESINTSLIDLRKWPYSFNLITEYTSSGSYESLAYNQLYVAGCSAIANLVDLTTNYIVSNIVSNISLEEGQLELKDNYDSIFIDKTKPFTFLEEQTIFSFFLQSVSGV